MGWVWGYSGNISCNNRIEANWIHDIGTGALSDIAGIYTLGVQPGTVIRGNLVHDVKEAVYGGRGIYPDEGSSFLVIENNICFRTDSHPFFVHYGKWNLVRNNIFAFGNQGTACLGREDDDPSFLMERNILLTSGKPIFDGHAAKLRTGLFESDWNLLWDVAGQAVSHGYPSPQQGVERLFPATSMSKWMEIGFDRHSIVTDPLIPGLAEDDFTLAPNSPAFTLGFVAIDLSDVGIRPQERRE